MSLDDKLSLGNKKGFSLIEMLVVISVISILVTMLYAGVTIARRRAMRNAEITKIGEVYTANESYRTMTGKNFPTNPTDRTDNSAMVDEAKKVGLLRVGDRERDKDRCWLDQEGNRYHVSETRLIGSQTQLGQGYWNFWGIGKNHINEYGWGDDITIMGEGSAKAKIETQDRVRDGPQYDSDGKIINVYELIPKSP